MTRIAEQEAGTLTEVIDRVAAGEVFVVTRDGADVAVVSPAPQGPREVVPSVEAIRAFADLPPMDYDRFRADMDAAFAEDRIHGE